MDVVSEDIISILCLEKKKSKFFHKANNQREHSRKSCLITAYGKKCFRAS